jgi:HK97 family phage portal protein
MAQRPEGKPIEPSLIKRLSQGLTYAFTGKDTWMSPGQEIQPTLDVQQQEQVRGRKLDFGVGINTRVTPMSEDNDRALSYTQLKGLANYDLVRMAIRTRTDQVSGLSFKVMPRDKKQKQDQRCKDIEKMLRRPGAGPQSFNSWLREIVESLLIIDTVVVQPKKTLGGQITGFELVDGALIKKIVDETGRTPEPPNTAYQQILKGIPAVDFTTEELLVVHRNTSTDRIYGRSPVEEIATTINIGLRRQLNQLSYFTDSNIPAGFLSAPEDWTPDQIAEYSTFIDELLSGDLRQRSKVLVVPGNAGFKEVKEPPLKSEFDEWLARNVCYAFSLSPQALVKDNNRSTSETGAAMAKEEGLEPLINWIKTDLMDVLIEQYFGYDDIEFVWEEKTSVDPLIQSQINVSYANAGIKTKNEIRAELGLDPLQEEEMPTEPVYPNMPPSGPGPGGEKPDDQNTAKLYKHVCSDSCEHNADSGLFKALKKKVSTIDRERDAIKKSEKSVKKTLNALLEVFKAEALDAYKSLNVSKIAKADDEEDDDEIDPGISREDAEKESFTMIAGLSLSTSAFVAVLVKTYANMSKDGANQAINQLSNLGVNISDKEKSIRQNAIDYASERGADLVGMKSDGKGGWIANPDSNYSIAESTRDMLRVSVRDALEQGLSVDSFADVLENSYAFSEQRSEMIARTEMAWADVQGNLEAYRQSGQVQGKKWIAEQDACDDCVNNEKDGIIDIEDVFSDGSDGPPAHPNCKCDVIPVLKEKEDE